MAARPQYDAIVIGAGPAGAMAARVLANRGVRTLMIDKSSKGRWKVCGCCLGSVGTDVLRRHGLSRILGESRSIEGLVLAARGKQAKLGLHGFMSISRESLDGALVDAAIADGVETRWNTSAVANPDGSVALGDEVIHAGVIIDASGLRSRAEQVTRGGRIGLGMTTDRVRCPANTLTMSVARGGYLGRVALPDGRVDFAMAAKPSFVRRCGTPTEAARTIWAEAGLDGGEIPEGRWFGTPILRREARAQHGRILRVGDAAGYVEPFTGEGMSWALLGGSSIGDDALACIERGPQASSWPSTLRSLLARRHALCKAVSNAVRSPMLVRIAVGIAGVSPAIGSSSAALLSGSRRRVA